jgi:DNA-binding transcriptional ArsR family regulator
MPGRILVSPRFELFFALAAVLGTEPGEGETALWLAQARRKLDRTARRRMSDLAVVPAIWPVLASVLESAALEGETEAVIAALADLPPADFARRTLLADDPAVASFRQRLETDPGGLQEAAVDALRRFDRLAFAALWRRVRPDLEAAAHRAGAPGAEAEGTADLIVFPSLFGTHRFRFGEVLVLTRRPEQLAARPPIGRISDDPEPIFRALGDSTRYAIARLIGREAMTSAELARRLGVSGPTLTHHLRALRQARLVIEEKTGNRIKLRLDRRTIDGLGAMAAADLFGGAPVAIRRSRRA